MAYASEAGNFQLVQYYAHNLYFESAAMILALSLWVNFLRPGPSEKTSDAIAKLMDLAPKTAILLKDGKGNYGTITRNTRWRPACRKSWRKCAC